MDYILSYKLQQDGVPIYAACGGFVEHVKERWNRLDKAPEKKLLVGVKEPQLTLVTM